MDISSKNQTSSDIFMHIMDGGVPITLYSASASSKFPIGTIHRHFKEMESSGKIKVYHQSDSGRKKKMYGPTFYGLVYFARINPNIRARLENYFLLWIEHREFLDMLAGEGFETGQIPENSKHNKTLFKKYVEYGIAVENQIEMLKSNSKSIPHEMFVFIGEILLSSDPRYVSEWKYLYRNLPGLQKAIDSNIQNMLRMQKQLRSKH